MSDFARAIPVLPSPDLAVSADFYGGRLGFAIVFQAADYLIVRRDEMELHFWRTAEADLPAKSSCYIRGGQIAALHAEFVAANLPRLSRFEVRSWNMAEFYLHDPHGNLLRFGMAPEELPSTGGHG